MPKYEDEGIVEDNDDLETEEGGKKKGKGTTAIIAAFIVVIWIAIFALLVKLDVGGFGSSVLYPVLKDVPVLNKILPNVSDNSLSSNSGDTYSTLQEAIDRINELENSIAVYKKNSDENAQTISNLTAEVERLKTYEANQTAFETLKKRFDNEVVYTDNAPDINEYKTYYESIDPENAEVLYKQVVEQITYDDEVQDYAKTYSQMKPKEAAAIFDTMTDNLGLVSDILMCMGAQARADILGKMNAETAAKLTEIMEPSKK